jgi:hypothetical protein
MAKYISNRQQNLKIGITSYTESNTVLEVTGKVGIGTTNAITQLHLSGFSTTNSNLKIGSLEFQNYSLNNSFFGDNVYWNGSQMVRRSDGKAGLFYFIGDEGQFRLSPVGLANSATVNNPQLKINSNGGFGIGSSLSQNANNFTGANFYVNPDGIVLVGTISSTGTASQKLQVTGGAYVSGSVGIGTTNPTQSLDINGNLRLRGALLDKDNQSGTSGQVLISTGSGVDWADAASGNAISGITIREEGSIVGTADSVSSVNFVGPNVTATASGAGATITIADYVSNAGIATFATTSGVSTSVSGGTASVTQLNVSGVSTISVTSSTDALRITQLGSGNALVVEDSANPDTTPFVVTASGSVGIGTTNPTSKLTVQGDVSIASTVGIGTVIDIVPYDTLNSGTLSFEGSAGQLFSITNNLTSGSIFSVNDVSGIPSIDVNADGTVALTPFGGNLGIGTTNPTSKLSVVGDGNFTGVVTASSFSGNASSATFATTAGIATFATSSGIATFATTAGIATFATTAGIATYADNAGISTNLKGGLVGNIPYQSATDTTVFLANGSSGTILQSNGVGNAPSWITAAPAGAITGLTVRDEGTIVGGANSVSQFDFVGSNISVASTAGIATITIADNLVGTALSISGISTVGFLTATNIWNAGITTSSRLTLNGANNTVDGGGQIFLNGATGNRIDFNNNGVAAPAFTTRSAGTKLVLYPNVSGSNVDYAFGIEANTLWYSIPEAISGRRHRWYAGTTQLADLKGSGEFLLGSSTLTGTASQLLQVTGGAYVSGNVGIGTTNAVNNLQVFGGIVAGNATSATIQSGFSILRPNDSTPRTFAIAETDKDLRIGGGAWNSVNIRTAPSNEVRVAITSSGNIGIGTTNPTSKLSVVGDGNFTGVVTATTFFGALTGTATTASSVTANSVGLGTDTFGDYVRDITGTANQITVTGGTGEGSTPTLSIPIQFTAPQDVTVARDLQVDRNLNVTGNITIGGTTATLFTETLTVSDAEIVLGFRTDAFQNDISNDTTANHGGIAVASTEGTPLVRLVAAGIETLPATYKKILWFKAGTFSGLGTDAWLINYAVGIGSTQVPNGVRLAAGGMQVTDSTISSPQLNVSGVSTLGITTFIGAVSFGTSAYFGDNDTLNFGDSNDLRIYHNGTDSYIADVGTGNLILDTNGSGVVIKKFGTGENLARFLTDGAVELYYDNSNKFETTGYGATVFGILQSQGLQVSGVSTFLGITTHTAPLFGTQASFTGVVTASSFSGNASSATYADNAGIATYADNAGVSTSVIGGIGSITQLSVSGITTTGILNVGTGGTIITTTTGGLVGINTTNPHSRLDVRGTISIGRTDASTVNSIRSVTDINSWEYAGVFDSVSAQDTSPQDIYFKDDGTKMFILGDIGNDVNEYALSTAWEVNTATFTTNFSFASQETNPLGLYFKPDGSRMYICGGVGVAPTGDQVRSYTLSNPWDISTGVTYDSKAYTVSDTAPQGVYFKDDGLKMYVVGSTGDAVYEYSLSIAWELDSTITLLNTVLLGTANTLNLPLTLTAPTGIDFNESGTKMYITDTTRDVVARFDLSTPWDTTTTTFFDNVYVGFQELTPNGIFFQEDQSKAYIVGSSADTVFQYNTDVPSLELASAGITTRSSVIINNEARLNNRLYVTNEAHFSSNANVKGTLTVNSTTTVSGTFNHTGTTGSICNTTSANTVNIATGAVAANAQKTINVGTGGATNSRLVVNIGPTNLGVSTVRVNSGTNVLIGAGDTTGTASQPLQVTGGTYVSGNVGVGTTNPTSKLSVVGDGNFTGVVTATSFSGDGSQLTGISASGSVSISTNTTNSNLLIPYATSFGSTTGLGATSLLVYNPSSGNLGIGTTNPTSKLSVVGNGNFTGVVTATTFVGALTGTATTTTNIPNLTGDITSVNTVTSIAAGVIVDADINASAGIVDTKLATIATALKVSNSATTATNANTASAIVARDGSGNFSAGTITANLTGTASSTTNIPNLTGAITSNNTTTSLGSFTSAELATALTDETGSGAAVFATSPTLVTPILGAATATSIVVGSGVTINASGINASAGIITATSFSGSGTNLTGIVTSIVAGTNITVSGSTGQVTINASGGGAALDILEVMLFA